ncbi:MAG: transcriptional regulator GcvA [Xanthomonadales bacterium]|jgi:LysR family glycine cleavage system transcriptional activator|nr:transcriptional regulator GcvA [Xanthomonadales bacterium]
MPNVPLNALRTFEAVARHLSFSRGAEELNVTTAAVSSQVRSLEERLNQRLFRRRGKQITLTAAGRKLFPGVERGMRELRLAVQRLEADRSGGVLNISMMPSFLQKWLMPRLGGFQDAHPDLDLRISADDARIDFEETDFHAAIRFGPGAWEGLESELLLEDWILPVCSPRYLHLHGPIAGTEALGHHPLLFVDSEVWDPWFEAVGSSGRDRRQKILNDALAILMAAELGEGIALTRWSLVARDLAAGRLVRPVDTIVPTRWSYHFALPAHHAEMPKVLTFRNWLKAECDRFERPTPVKG